MMRTIRFFFLSLLASIVTLTESRRWEADAAPRRDRRVWSIFGGRMNLSVLRRDGEFPQIILRLGRMEKPRLWLVLCQWCGNGISPSIECHVNSWSNAMRKKTKLGHSHCCWLEFVIRFSFNHEEHIYIRRYGPRGMFLWFQWNSDWLAKRFGESTMMPNGDAFYTFRSKIFGVHTCC